MVLPFQEMEVVIMVARLPGVHQYLSDPGEAEELASVTCSALSPGKKCWSKIEDLIHLLKEQPPQEELYLLWRHKAKQTIPVMIRSKISMITRFATVRLVAGIWV